MVVDDAPLPRAPGLAIRAEGLWTDLTCETPLEHWSVGLEAFGVALDDPDEVFGRGLGERTALGLDVEWEVVECGEAEGASYALSCRTHGDVLVGRATHGLDGVGRLRHAWGVPDWWDASQGDLAEGGSSEGSAAPARLAAPAPLVDPVDLGRVARLRRHLGPGGRWTERVETSSRRPDAVPKHLA